MDTHRAGSAAGRTSAIGGSPAPNELIGYEPVGGSLAPNELLGY